jgi:hypothetical protein
MDAFPNYDIKILFLVNLWLSPCDRVSHTLETNLPQRHTKKIIFNLTNFLLFEIAS